MDTIMAAPQPVAEDYAQPDLPRTKSGWAINCLDYQILSKSDGWNQDQTKRLIEYEEAVKVGGINFVALATPYENLTKYTNYVTDARTKGFKIWHRSHWNAWQGDNGVGDIATVNSLTRSGSTATCVTSTPHLMVTGQTVSMNGMNETEYRGEFTITVVNSTTFTYTVSGTPTTPATGNIGWRYGRQTYLDKTYDFIVENPELFAAGDMFGMCVEADQADSSNMTFKTPGTTTFNTALYNQFQKDQVRYANAAFAAIGLTHQVHTWPISQQLSNLNLNGQELDSGSTGNASGLGDTDIVTYFGGYLATDHYCSDAITDGNTYFTAYNGDLDAIHAAFPSCRIMIGEIGFHTVTDYGEGAQYGAYSGICKALRSKPFVIGVNFWNHLGQTQSSLWTDTSGTIVKGGRKAVDALRLAFNAGNKAFGWRVRV